MNQKTSIKSLVFLMNAKEETIKLRKLFCDCFNCLPVAA